MMDQTEEIVAGDFDASQAVINNDVAEVLRSQPDDPLIAAFGVDEVISEISKAVDRRLELVCGENIELSSCEISVFSKTSLFAFDEDAVLNLCIRGDEEELVSCMMFNIAFVRQLIMKALAGSEDSGTSDTDVNLHAAEKAILRVIADQIMQACFEAVDTLSNSGFPRKPEFIDMKQMTAIVETNELIRISFIIGEENPKSEFQLLVPLAVFDNTGQDTQDSEARRKASDEERQWTSKLLDQIEVLQIPLTVELACTNLPLAQVDDLQVGNHLELDINPQNINLLDAEGHVAFMASLEVGKKHFQLNVRGIDSAEGA